MKLSAQAAKKFFLAMTAATVLLTILRAIAYYVQYDAAIGYFSSAWISSLLYDADALAAMVIASAIVTVFSGENSPFPVPSMRPAL